MMRCAPASGGTALRGFDLSSWQGLVTTLLGLALFALIGVGIRLLVMMTIQQRQQRLNRQINERLKTLIAAYKVLGGSFTGTLTVDPGHRRDLRRPAPAAEAADPGIALPLDEPDNAEADGVQGESSGADRRRRIRDAVEAALSDIILLGTEEQVRLAEQAARELTAGHPVHTHELVVSLRNFIRKALDLEPIPADLTIPMQGPTRPQSAGGRGRGEGAAGGRAGGGGAGGGGAGMGMGLGAGSADDSVTSSVPRPGR